MASKHALLTASVALALATMTLGDLGAAEKFEKLAGSQIRGKLAGMEITDQVHSADVFAPNGALTSYAMSRKTVGKWQVQKDQLCFDRGKDFSGCYEVWLSGKRVELRHAGSTFSFFEGVLQRPSNHR